MLLASAAFSGLAARLAGVMGMPSLRTVVLPHPVGGIPIAEVLQKVDAVVDEIIGKLTLPLAQKSAPAAAAPRNDALIDIATADHWADDWADLQSAFIARGWSDGLPVVPPTEAHVAAMVKASRFPPEHVVEIIPPNRGLATVEKIAVNAVMAGCRPEHMPVLIAAIIGLADAAFSLKNVQATTHPVAPLLVVAGPLVQTLNINAGSGVFGPGPWANGAIGRAIRLVMLNIGGGTPIEIDKATMGNPGKFSYCIAENDAASPWPTLRAERGFAPETSIVTVFAGEAPHNINDHESTTAGGLLTTIAGAIAQTGQNNVYYPSELLVLLSPEHAHTIAADGYTKDDVKKAIYEQARIPLSRFSRENRERRLWRFMPKRYLNRPLDTLVAVVQQWQDVVVIVTGGAGKHSMYVPTTGSARSISTPVLKPDGSAWLPADFANC